MCAGKLGPSSPSSLGHFNRHCREKSTVTYEEIAPAIRTNPLSVRNALEPVQHYCLSESLPPLTSLVVGKITQRPGKGFIAWDPSNIEAAHRAVYAFDWDLIPNPYAGFSEDDSVDDFADRLLANPSGSKDIFTRVQARGVRQAIFRAALLKAYSARCAVCGFSVACALDAAHIAPWCDAEDLQQLDPRNGLLLCSTHHRLFDAGLIKVDDSYKVICTREMLGEHSNVHSNFSQTIALNGRLLGLPARRELWPEIQALAKHRLAGC